MGINGAHAWYEYSHMRRKPIDTLKQGNFVVKEKHLKVDIKL